MAFHHLAGTTAFSAPDEIVDWFATFEAWINAVVGWTVESGAGTDDLVLSSPGEIGTLTKLFIHIWRVPATDTVRMEVRDDALGTHETNEAGLLNSSGVQFNFWMSADLDAIVIVWTGYYPLYAGIVIPFALAPPDETYHMIASDDLWTACSILRDSAGVWDTDLTMYSPSLSDNYGRCPIDGVSFPLMPRTVDRWGTIAGELKHTSAWINAGSVAPEDTLQTGLAPNTTDWIVLADTAGNKFALRTGGVGPTGVADGAHFAHQAGVAASNIDLITNIIPAFLTGIGWTDLGDHPFWLFDYTRMFHSTGESGLDDIYIHILHRPGVNSYIYLLVHDDAAMSHSSAPDKWGQQSDGWYPASYLLSGDRDCFCFTVQHIGGGYGPWWLGKVAPGIPAADAAGSDYNSATKTWQVATPGLLRSRRGTWGQSCMFTTLSDLGQNSNANAFDGTTYFVWPNSLNHGLDINDMDLIGTLQYYMYTHGGGIAQMDTITVGAQVYTVLLDPGLAAFWAMRTT